MKINHEVMKHIKQFEITEKESKLIARCISRYSTPKTFSDALTYVAYRVLNSIKAVFGCSDWQLSGKLVMKGMKLDIQYKKKIYAALKESGIKNKELTGRINNKVIPLMDSIREYLPNMVLEILVLKNETKNEKTVNKAIQIFRTRMNSIENNLKKEISQIKNKYGLDLSSFK